MKVNRFFLLITALFLIASCNEPIPKNYGIYVFSKGNLNFLKPQKTISRGNLLRSISGVKGTSGAVFENLKYIIVFERNIKPDDIRISELKFKRGGYVRNLFGNSYVEINLWTSERDIAINVGQIDGKKDMYKVTPSHPLDNGFYALHFGSLTNHDTYSAFNKVAYDFVIGTNLKAYQPYQIIIQRNKAVFLSHAEQLLEKVNRMFNSNNYDSIRKIYLKPDGTEFNTIEWNSLTKGFANWKLLAGRIKSSKIIYKSISENNGFFMLQTEYEKAGIVKEKFNVLKKGNSYFITMLGGN